MNTFDDDLNEVGEVMLDFHPVGFVIDGLSRDWLKAKADDPWILTTHDPNGIVNVWVGKLVEGMFHAAMVKP